MRKSVDELNQISPDYAADRRQEIAAPPDEFNRTPVKKPKEKKRSSVWKAKATLYLASAGVVTLGIITPIVRVNPEKSAQSETPAPSIVVEATPEATEKPSITPAPTPSAQPAVTEEPTAEPTAATMLSGKIHVVVYSDVFNSENAPYPSEIIADEMLDVETFTAYRLPPLPVQEGYRAIGYVLTRYSGLAYLQSLYFDNADPDVIGTIPLGDTLSTSDLMIVPQGSDEIYEAEIHVVWLQDGSKFHLEFYDEDLFGEYDVGFPVYSEGLCYLAAFPVPEREGKAFIGWSDKNGRIIDAVTYFDFFPEKPDAQTMEDREWDRPIPCPVYACWSDGTGGPPPVTPAPSPEEVKMCTISALGCSIVAGGETVDSGTAVPAGTVVTCMAWGRAYRGMLVMTLNETGQSVSSGTIYGTEYIKYMKYGDAEIWAMFSTTFVVTGDAVIKFIATGG
jgi:hypothetical protein